MASKHWTEKEKDKLLLKAFRDLETRDIKSELAKSATPFTELQNECSNLMRDKDFANSIEEYLRPRSIVRRAVKMFFTYIAMSARAKWDDVPPAIRPVTARGWFLGRWLPTFLIIDGPIGRFLNSPESPLNKTLPIASPMLDAARNFLQNKEFYKLRNGFAHWGFDWEIVGNESYVVAYNWETDLPIIKLHQKEADAFHIITFSIIEILNSTMINPKL
ncbi:MAG: hypothetical protein IT395_05185 [Candidatus Omnitrophica bacterium]|nr:hypothetical protein [Candidatus Omnitrophota bacterium]